MPTIRLGVGRKSALTRNIRRAVQNKAGGLVKFGAILATYVFPPRGDVEVDEQHMFGLQTDLKNGTLVDVSGQPKQAAPVFNMETGQATGTVTEDSGDGPPAEVKPLTFESPVAELAFHGISQEHADILAKHEGFKTVEDVLDCEDLTVVKGIGAKTAGIIAPQLNALVFADDDSDGSEGDIDTGAGDGTDEANADGDKEAAAE